MPKKPPTNDPLGILEEESTDPLGILSEDSVDVVPPQQEPSLPSGEKLREIATLAATGDPTAIAVMDQYKQKLDRASTKKQKPIVQDLRKVDITEKQDAIKSPEIVDIEKVQAAPEMEALQYRAYAGNRSDNVASDVTRQEGKSVVPLVVEDYLDFVMVKDENSGNNLRTKYEAVKTKTDKTAEDETFLRDIEKVALEKKFAAKDQELRELQVGIEDLQSMSDSPEKSAALKQAFTDYARTSEVSKGLSSMYEMNPDNYGGAKAREEENKTKKAAREQNASILDELGTSFSKAVGSGITSIAQVPKVLGDMVGDSDYDWADKLYDATENFLKEREAEFGALDEGKIPTSVKLAQLGGSALGSAATFAAGGLGAGSKAGQAARTFGTAFLVSESDYYKESLAAGMSPKDAAKSATYLAAATAAVESIIPDIKYFEPSAFRKSVTQGVAKGLKAGKTASESAKLALKNALQAVPESAGSLIKTGTKEAGEEVAGQLAEDLAKESMNAAGEKEYFKDTFNPKDYLDSALGGFMVGGGLSVMSRPQSPVQEQNSLEVVENADEILPNLPEDQKAEVEPVIATAKESLDALKKHSEWENLSPKDQAHAFALTQQAAALEEEQKAIAGVRLEDKAKAEQIKAIEEELNTIFNGEKVEDKNVPAATSEAVQETGAAQAQPDTNVAGSEVGMGTEEGKLAGTTGEESGSETVAQAVKAEPVQEVAASDDAVDSDGNYNKTQSDFLKIQKEELGNDYSDIIEGELRNEYYKEIEDIIKKGGKISIDVYNGLDSGQKYAFDKKYGKDKIGDETLYHSTTNDFEQFDLDKSGTKTDEGWFGKGVYFFRDKKDANDFSLRDKNSKVREAKVSLKNPLILNTENLPKNVIESFAKRGIDVSTIFDVQQFALKGKENAEKITDVFLSEGYDGLRLDLFPKKEVVVFNTSQIKSVAPTQATTSKTPEGAETKTEKVDKKAGEERATSSDTTTIPALDGGVLEAEKVSEKKQRKKNSVKNVDKISRSLDVAESSDLEKLATLANVNYVAPVNPIPDKSKLKVGQTAFVSEAVVDFNGNVRFDAEEVKVDDINDGRKEIGVINKKGTSEYTRTVFSSKEEALEYAKKMWAEKTDESRVGTFDAVDKITEEYRKAKADGSNPELVKAVESLVATASAPPTKSADVKNDKTKATTEVAADENQNKTELPNGKDAKIAKVSPAEKLRAKKKVEEVVEESEEAIAKDVDNYSEPKKYSSEIKVGQRYYDSRYGDFYIIEKMTPVEGGDVDAVLKYDKGKTRTESGNFLLYHIDAKQHSLSKDQSPSDTNDAKESNAVASSNTTPIATVNNTYYTNDLEGSGFVEAKGAKKVDLDYEGDYFYYKSEYGFKVFEAKTGSRMGEGKTLKAAISDANDRIKRNTQSIPLETFIKSQYERTGLSPRYQEVEKEKIPAKIRSLKVKGKTFESTLGIPVAVYNGALEAAATAWEVSEKAADAIKAAIDHIKESKWYKSLSDDDKVIAESEMSDEIGDAFEEDEQDTEGAASAPREADEEKQAATVEAEKDEGEVKERKTITSIKEAKDISDDIKSAFHEDRINYEVLPNDISVKEASALIDAMGIDEAIKFVTTTSTKLRGAFRTATAQILIKKLSEQGRNQEAIDVAESIAELATDWGQAIQALSLFKYLTPEGQILAAQRDIERQRDKKLKTHRKTIDKVGKAVEKANKEAIDETLKRVSGQVGEAAKSLPKVKRPQSYGAKNKIVTKSAYEKAKEEMKATQFLLAAPVPQLVTVAAYHIEAGARDFAEFSKRMVEDFGDKVKDYLEGAYDEALATLDKEEKEQTIAELSKEFGSLLTQRIPTDKARLSKEEKLNKIATELDAISGTDEYSRLAKEYEKLTAEQKGERKKEIEAKAEQRKKERLEQAWLKAKDRHEKRQAEKAEMFEAAERDRLEQEKNDADLKEVNDAFKAKKADEDAWIKAKERHEKKQAEIRERADERERERLKKREAAAKEKEDERLAKSGEKTFDRATSRSGVEGALRDMDIRIQELIRSHYTEVGEAGKSLAAKLVSDLGLTGDEATRLEGIVGREFGRIVGEKKRNAIRAVFNRKNRKKPEVKKLEDKLVEASNLGLIDKAKLDEIYADAMGFPKLTDENVKKLKALADKVQNAQEGRFKDRAVEDLFKYREQIKGYSMFEAFQSVWMANILSGWKTQTVNIVANMINSAALFSTGVAQTVFSKDIKNSPMATRLLAKGLFIGLKKGFLEGVDVMRTGYGPIRGKVEIPNVLERMKFVGGKFNPANYAKFVRRFMLAADTFSFEGLRQMRAFQLAYKQAVNEKNESPDLNIRNRVLEIMNRTDGAVEIATELAQSEYEETVDNIKSSSMSLDEKNAAIKQARIDKKFRVYEFLEMDRPHAIQAESHDFAARGTFNHKPEGALGMVSEYMNSFLHKAPAARFVIPFVNVISNVANTTLDWSPIGAIRAQREGQSITGLNKREGVTDQQKADLMTKAIMGTSVMAVAYLLTKMKDDDDEPLLEVTTNGYGDFVKNAELANTGWRPYSFRVKLPTGGYSPWISYKYSPFMLGLSYIGGLNDFENYRKEKISDEGWTKAGVTASGVVRSFADNTFLSSGDSFLNTVLDHKNENMFDDLTGWANKTATSMVVPNLYTQTAQQMEEFMDVPQKEIRETFMGRMMRDIPVARNEYFDKVNGLGEKVSYDNDIFISLSEGKPSDKLWNLVVDKKAPIGSPVRTITYVDDNDVEKFMDEKQFYNFSRIRGGFIKSALRLNYYDVKDMDNATFSKWLSDVKSTGTTVGKVFLDTRVPESAENAFEYVNENYPYEDILTWMVIPDKNVNTPETALNSTSEYAKKLKK
jgi:hypothetical protein